MSRKSDFIRISGIPEKNPREIVMLRGTGCRWRRCRFCDYHLDASPDESANFRLNREILDQVTGRYGCLEVINSGSFPELDEETMSYILWICVEKGIRQVHFECHWMYRRKIPTLRERFAAQGIRVKVKIGVESFDPAMREDVMDKGMAESDPSVIAAYFDEVCLLFGLTGQTEDSMRRDLAMALAHFERVCVNVMTENTAALRPDPAVIGLFINKIYPEIQGDSRVDILLENTDFGVGGER